MKSFSTESEEPVFVDIEVCHMLTVDKKNIIIIFCSCQDIDPKKKCTQCPFKRNDWTVASRSEDDPIWYRPSKLSDVFDEFNVSKDLKIKLVCGDTGRGKY